MRYELQNVDATLPVDERLRHHLHHNSDAPTLALVLASKSGFDGDITTYQITAPIQGGNSGGPLFDDKGNFIGINSSGLRADVADNVGYTIKSSYVMNLIDVLPKSIELPSNSKLQTLPLTEQIKEISKYVVLVKVK